ncbi:SCO family protein [Leisingera sp. ANG-M1]|uniref:SCO family protein n=1 Tax=Leisingera sp. ANG-M1 TaxID=1577895 RepID=UPI000B01F5C5|nr:SCO family protein [Leisingera sp. ANG-M1]
MTGYKIGLFILWGLAAVSVAAIVGFVLPKYQAGRSVSEAEGGFRPAFELTDHTGSVRTSTEFEGRWKLVFFGFTNCPDICPTGLSTISEAMDGLGSKAEDVQPLFITVDPARDTPETVADYLEYFHPSVIGLTGNETQISAASKAFKVFYQRQEDPNAPDGYTMGHSSAILLFRPDGYFERTFAFDASSDEILLDLEQRL